MTRLWKLLSLLLLLLAPAAARADELQALVERHLAWRGGEAYARVQRVHLRASTTTGGLKGTLESWSVRDGRSRVDADLGALRSSQAILPEGSWAVNASGQVEDAAPSAVRDAQHRTALDFDEALRGRAGAKLALLPDEPRDGRTWKVLRVTFGDEDRYDLFLAAQDGALHGLRIQEDGRTRFVRLSDWRQVQGVRMPFLEEEFSDHPDGNSRTEVQALTLDAPLPKDLFARPRSTRRAHFAGGRKSTGFMPFDFYAENRIYIPAKVNGRSTRVLLDSGAEMTVLDTAYARKLGLKPEGKLPAVGAGGHSQAQLVSGVDIVLGDLQLRGLTVAVMDLSQVAQMLGRPLPVILGKEVFNQLVVDVDFPNRRVAFHSPEGLGPPLPMGAVRVPLREGAGRLRTLELSVEGRAPIPVLFDLGNGGTLSLYASYWKKAGLLEGRPRSRALSGAVGGLQERDVAVLKSVSLAGVTVHDVPTMFDGVDESISSSDRTLGNLGLQVLSRFRLITDYARDTVWLVPNAQALKAPFRKDRSGLILMPRGAQLEVLLVAPDSPAAEAGWKKGERVVAIEGKPIPPGYDASPLSRWRFRPAGQSVKLKLADGSERTLTLRDYY